MPESIAALTSWVRSCSHTSDVTACFRWTRSHGFFHTQTRNLHPQWRQQWCAAGKQSLWEFHAHSDEKIAKQCFLSRSLTTSFSAGSYWWEVLFFCLFVCAQRMLDYLKDKKDVGFFLSVQALMQTCRSVMNLVHMQHVAYVVVRLFWFLQLSFLRRVYHKHEFEKV